MFNYSALTRAYNEGNNADNNRNKEKCYKYALLDKNFCRTGVEGICSNLLMSYDEVRDENVYSFVDIDTQKRIGIPQWYVELEEVV